METLNKFSLSIVGYWVVCQYPHYELHWEPSKFYTFHETDSEENDYKNRIIARSINCRLHNTLKRKTKEILHDIIVTSFSVSMSQEMITIRLVHIQASCKVPSSILILKPVNQISNPVSNQKIVSHTKHFCLPFFSYHTETQRTYLS